MSDRSSSQADGVVYFMGDVYLPSPVVTKGEVPGALVYNLEAPLTHATRGWPRTVNLRCEQDHSVTTFGRRPLAVCLANNHIMDFGALGLTETTRRLNDVGVAHFGAGDFADNCRNPLLLNVGDQCLALMGYVCPSAHPVFAVAGEHAGVAPIDLNRIEADIRAARAGGATRIVACLHWGIEDVELPRPKDVRVARAVARMGVDLVIGHHAHCIQPFEIYDGVPIFYGLGNAIFPDVEAWENYDDEGNAGEPYRKKQNYWNRRSLAVAFDVETRTVRVDLWTCDGATLHLVRRNVRSPSFTLRSTEQYDSRFRRHHFYAVWRMKLVNYVRSPRLPRARHIRSIWKIMNGARGSS